ncbi:MAG: TA system VapC family ribonuclease toxin [Acidobacteriota bacterium]
MKKASSKKLLLDVNVLLALAWPNHQFHAPATRRLGRKTPWATCALTELGFIRLSSNPAVVGVTKSPGEAASLLTLMKRDEAHFFIESLPSPTNAPFSKPLDQILGSRQVTDAYLVALAQSNQAILLTFDTRLAEFPEVECLGEHAE